MSTVTDKGDRPKGLRARLSEDESFRYPLIAVGLALVLLVVTYLVARFSSHPIAVTLLVILPLLIALAVAGVMAARRGRAASFVAVALVLPYFMAGAAFYGGAQHIVDAISGVFDTASADTSFDFSEDTSEPVDDNGDGTDDSEDTSEPVDDNGDGTDDSEYAGSICSDLFSEDAELYDQCVENGGDAGGGRPIEGEGDVSVEPEDDSTLGNDGSGPDDNGDGVPDNAYQGSNCSNSNPFVGAIKECTSNGGFKSDVGSGVVKGEPGFKDANQDFVDDEYYAGVDCSDIEGGQMEFVQCTDNGGD